MENTVVNTGCFKIAPTQPIAVIARKIKHKHIQKESTFPLPLITSLRPPLGSLPLKTIQPLSTRVKIWQAIPRVSDWVLGIIKWGYTLQFARRPLRFGGVVSTSVQHSNAHVLRTEVMNLLAKGAVETISPVQRESGFYSRYFLVHKKDGGLRPILNIRHLNRALMKRPFRMITSKQILSQICPGDWFFSLDLKDAYFHIQIAPTTCDSWDSPSREWLNNTRSFPLGCPWLPALLRSSPLRQMGIRILNYLDDWLILAQSEDELLSHRSVLLSHLRVPRTQGQFCQEQKNSYRLSSNEGSSHARTCTGHSAAHFIQQLHSKPEPLAPSQSISKDAGPHGLSVFSTSVGPASHAAPSVLAETSSSSTRLASRTPPCQGEPGLRCSSCPLEKPSVDGTGRALGYGLQKEGGLDRRFQLRLGGAVRRQTSQVTFTSTAWKCWQYVWAFAPFCQTWGGATS